MENGWQRDVINFINSIRDSYNHLIDKTFTISKKLPLYVKEGSHRVFIEYEDTGENKETYDTYSYDVIFSLLEDDKEILGFFVSYDDTTEDEKLEEESAKSENLSAEREIAASYVHEIKNPLFSIRGFLQILQQSFSEDDQRKAYTEIMINELDRMNDLLNEFLSTYRSKMAKDVDQGRIGIGELVKEVMAFFRYSFDIKDITYNLDIDDNLYVSIDRDQFFQVMINIIQNSVEAMIDGGKLNIRAYSKGDFICIEIKDNGVGISEKDIKKIFEPFFTTKEKGTGLGLCIIKKIIENNGGRISLKSKVGEGTTIYLELPTAGIESD
ncbi:MAG TPA: GHKL domain-containing protein [Thermoanaerobacterales bacterium]|nr:GHKL domain-containing protein [Thermoanaerobacterales bacterium]